MRTVFALLCGLLLGGFLVGCNLASLKVKTDIEAEATPSDEKSESETI